MQKQDTTDLRLNSVKLHRGPTGCLNICWELREDSLSCIAQCSNVIPSSERPACVYLVTTLWPNAKHMPLSNAFWCAHVQAFAYWIQTPYSCPLNYSLMGSEDYHCTQQVTGSTLSLTNLTLKSKR